jgi:hypothetical protein
MGSSTFHNPVRPPQPLLFFTYSVWDTYICDGLDGWGNHIIHTSPGSHTASYTMGIRGNFHRDKAARALKLTVHFI